MTWTYIFLPRFQNMVPKIRAVTVVKMNLAVL